MLMARGNLPPLYAHCLGAGASPRVTVTSHRDNTGRVVWYLGGDLSESGVERDFDQQIAAGRGELQQVLPWFEFDGVEWSTFRVDRAEPVQSGGKRPSSCYADLTDGIITTWPTKLAFAPQLADEVLSLLSDSGIAASGLQETGLSLPKPPISMPPWETREKWI